MSAPGEIWASDTPISRPEAIRPEAPMLVDLGGFAMTAGGLAHGASADDIEEIFTPTYAPEGYRRERR
jgi:hypothetical protein